MPEISVLMPAYNEGKNLEKAVKETMKELKGLDYEIVLINDGSEDNTLEVAKKLRESFKEVRVVSYHKNRGKGHALKKGFEKSSGKMIVFFDSDLDIPPSQIKRFLKVLNEGYDVVIGSKYLPGARVSYSEKRKAFSIWYRTLVKMLLKLDVSDTQVGLKVFRREVLERVFPKILVKKYAFDVELLTVINMYGYKIRELPVKIEHKHFNSSVNYKAILRMFIDTMAVFYRKNILHYYER